MEVMAQEEMFISSEVAEERLTAKKVLRGKIEAIYDLYPRKMGKMKGIERLLRGKHSITLDQVDSLRNAVIKLVNQKREAQFIPHFSSFVTNWEDYLNTESKKISW